MLLIGLALALGLGLDTLAERRTVCRMHGDTLPQLVAARHQQVDHAAHGDRERRHLCVGHGCV